MELRNMRNQSRIGVSSLFSCPEKFLFRSLTYFKYFDMNFDVSSGRIFVIIFY